MDDEGLYSHIRHAVATGLPVLGQHYEHDGVAVIVGSGPSLADNLEDIKRQRSLGRPIVALKDAHDWLIERGVIPDYAVAIDPQPHRFDCFKLKNPSVKYLIASQCATEMFDHLKGLQVYLWHLYIRKGQTVPEPGTPLIAGGTTTGLRTITLFYTLGFRHVELYGMDSCLKNGKLRVNGDVSNNETVNEIVVDGKMFYCNPAMTAQANEFQNLYQSMPDLTIESHGDGLITAIVEARKKQPKWSVSFINRLGPGAASYRYRAALPAAHLGASINDMTASVLVIAKPDGVSLDEVRQAKINGQRVIVDICDNHLDRPHYREMVRLADEVTCATPILAAGIAEFGRTATVISDPYERDELDPHCFGDDLLWYGHALNRPGLERILPDIANYPLRVVSNHPHDIPWTHTDMAEEYARADIVVMPMTAAYKSANRTIEAIRQGCFVVAEPHPAINDFPGIWIGDIKKGIEWATQNQDKANQRTRVAQDYIREKFSPRTVACAWSQIIAGSSYTSDQDT